MITKNYIKQCEMAEEIQKEWIPENGDWVFWKTTNSIKIITDHFETPDLKDFIWLPTQEQLWKRIWKLEKTCTFSHSFDISRYDKKRIGLVVRSISNESGYIEEYFENTIQECLLKHIYGIEYDKVWDGKKWGLNV